MPALLQEDDRAERVVYRDPPVNSSPRKSGHLRHLIEETHHMVQKLLEIIEMSVDPNVQKIVDDVAQIGLALQTVLTELGNATTQNSSLKDAITQLQSTGGLSAENAAVLHDAATALEGTIAAAKAAVPAAPAAPAATGAAPAAAPAADAATGAAPAAAPAAGATTGGATGPA